MVYIPSTVGEVSDRIGSLVLCMPDMELSNSGLDMDGAYAQLEHSLGLIRKKIGEEKYHALVQMGRASKQKFVENKTKDGRFLLQDMSKLIKGKIKVADLSLPSVD
jgi:hypothetical protein